MQLHTSTHTHTQARIAGANVTKEESQQRSVPSGESSANGKLRSMTWHVDGDVDGDDDALTVSCVIAVALPSLFGQLFSDSQILWYWVNSNAKKTCSYNNTDVIAAENQKWGVDETAKQMSDCMCLCVCVWESARVCVLVSLSKLPSQMTMGSTPAGQYWLTTNAMQTTATTATTTTTNTNTCSSSNYNSGDSAVLLVFR